MILEFAWGTQMAFAVSDIRERLDRFFPPEGADRPLILRYDPSLDPVLTLGLTGDMDLIELRRIAEEELEESLAQVSGVAAVKVRGGDEEEIRVSVDEQALTALNLDIGLIGQRLQAENLNAASGSIEEIQTEFLVRALNEYRNLDEIGDTILERRGDVSIRVRDVARITRVPAEKEVISRIRDGLAFSTREPLANGYSVIDADGERWLARGLSPFMRSAELPVPGRHGEANALAALALTEALGGALAPALDAVRNFEGLPHRFAPVATVAGVAYVDDSKATNVGATAAALDSLSGSAVLIAGGLGKGADFAPVAEAARGRLRAAVLLGESAPVLAEALDGVCPIARVDTMPDAVTRAAEFAAAGDTVLLSPACASQDMFADYRERGAAFAAAVRELAQ